MHRRLHPCSSVDKLYIPRAQGGRGLLSVKDCVELERSNLFDYTANNNARFLKAATEELQLRTKIDVKNKEEWKTDSKKRESIAGSIPERKRGDAMSKEMAVSGSSWAKTGTESLICAAQEQALRTNLIKSGTDHQDVSPLCRLCKEKVESSPILSVSCSVQTGNQYIKRHNKLGKKY